MQEHGNLPHPDPRGIHLAEHFLQPNRQNRSVRVAVIKRHTGPAGHRDVSGCFPVERLPAVPVQHPFKRFGQRQTLQLPQIAHALQIGA
ncbi:hypothetical protein D3C80_1971070 [compost metagenome]